MFPILILNLFLILSSQNSVNNLISKPLDVSSKYQKQIDTDEINHLLGKFDYKKDSSFIFVESKYASKSMYLRKETYSKFIEMYDAAKKE